MPDAHFMNALILLSLRLKHVDSASRLNNSAPLPYQKTWVYIVWVSDELTHDITTIKKCVSAHPRDTALLSEGSRTQVLHAQRLLEFSVSGHSRNQLAPDEHRWAEREGGRREERSGGVTLRTLDVQLFT